SGLRQEADQRRGVEIEHLSPRELSLQDLIETEHRAIESVAIRIDPPLTPEHDDFVVARGHDTGIHPSLGLARLEGEPRVAPGGDRAAPTTRSPTVGERWWPVELHVGMAEVEEALSIASLDRAKDLEHHLDVFACTHACLISSRGEHRRSTGRRAAWRARRRPRRPRRPRR